MSVETGRHHRSDPLMRSALIGWASADRRRPDRAGHRQLLHRPLDGQGRGQREAVDHRHRQPMVVGRPVQFGATRRRRFRTANELHLPVGVPARIMLQSNDVIHSFWVPSLAGKQDLIPGRDNDITHRAAQDRHLPRPVRRILRRPARAHGARRRRRQPCRLRQMVATAQLQPAPRAAQRRSRSAGYDLCHDAPVQRVPHDRRHARQRHRRARPHPFRQPPDASPPGTLPMSEGNLYGWVADPQSRQARQQHADDRPRA